MFDSRLNSARIVKAKLVFLLGILAFPLFASNLDLNALLARANSQSLHETEEWRRILFQAAAPLGTRDFLVDSKEFYLCPNHKYDLKCELEYTLRKAFEPQTDSENPRSQHVQCQFPRRVEFLKKHLKLDPNTLPKTQCRKFSDWTQLMTAEAVSLVFSSSYLNNPGSMFGHTFLRFHKKPVEGNSPVALLDPTVSYAASDTSSNPLLYVVGGIFGWFPGTFSMAPYYLKVQEYNNSERRDLWEFELNLNRSQIQNLAASLWEIGPHHGDYYFLHRNCALLPLALIESVDLNAQLTSQMTYWLIPSDSVRILRNDPKMIKAVHYRPSSLTRFEERYHRLTEEEKQEVLSLFEKPFKETQPKLVELDTKSRAKILDSALDYIEFDEKLAGSKMAEKYATLQREILALRAKTSESPEKIVVSAPQAKQPDLGHNTGRISIGSLYESTKGSVLTSLQWRPALHSMEDNALGYSPDLSIRFLDTEVTYDLKKSSIDLRNLEVLQVTSIAPTRSMVKPWATHFSLGREYTPGCTRAGKDCHRSRLRVGAGLALSPDVYKFIGYGLILLDGGYVADPSVGWHVGPEVEFGTRMQLTEGLQWVNSGTAFWRYGFYPMQDIRFQSRLHWQFKRDWAIGMSAEYFNSEVWWGAKFHGYF